MPLLEGRLEEESVCGVDDDEALSPFTVVVAAAAATVVVALLGDTALDRSLTNSALFGPRLPGPEDVGPFPVCSS